MPKIKISLEETVVRFFDAEIKLPNGMDKETFIERINNDDSECLTLFWQNAIADDNNSETISQSPYKINEN